MDDCVGLGGWFGVGVYEIGKVMFNLGIIRSFLYVGLCFSYISCGLVYRYVFEIRSFYGVKV